ncbi:heme-degrading monooxygenase HmoA [Aliiruegeria haliotis]|uniref:Heme-degrading monooxygenase HmoA n=1 Tax=Aliiruegeria haliotis TaxID=1280846 RepID=A0A2T0RW97_9RHOB|nr:antibiotic biosynthesis monooxygenase [Aliiruegeria haliotis]PRY25402.1 heme-degrading monooxygenase HmoA [Aliiruegeria haliotis]
MFLTMNRFQIKPGCEDAFEAIWKGRESKLPDVPGFVSFHLMRGPEMDDHTLYASHTMWASEDAFRDWTKSEAFRQAHSGVRSSKDIYIGAPELEVFSSVQSIG